MAAPLKPILWNYYLSSASWRVRLALNLKNIEFEYKSVNILRKDGGEQYSPEFTKVNPKQEVPALLIDGHLLVQSLPIIEYVNETRKNHGPNLLPSDPLKRAKARSIAEIINSGIQPYQNTSVAQRIARELGDAKKAEWLHFFIAKGLTALEATLKETSGKYCVGDEVTLADLCLVPQVYAAKRFNVNVDKFALVNRINAELEQLPEFKKAHAHRQPDTIPKLREP